MNTSPKRVLLVCYTQTGQLRRCADALLEPMRRAGVEVDVVEPRPAAPYNFPWSFGAFVDVFPECVRGVAPPMDLGSLAAPHAKYDLVVLAYQVWYLAPSLPVVGWLESDAATVLDKTPVVALCACRNMWQRAFVTLKGRVAARGGRIIDHVVREDSGPAWATFWSTPRWMLTGDKVGLGLLPAAGVSDAAVASLRGPGARLAAAVLDAPVAHSVLNGAEAKLHRAFVIPELAARFFFGLWAAAITRAGQVHSALRWLLARAFFVTLCSSLVLLLPAAVAALVIRLLARQWFQGKVDEVAT